MDLIRLTTIFTSVSCVVMTTPSSEGCVGLCGAQEDGAVISSYSQDLVSHYYDLCLLLDYILEASSFYESFLKGCMLICNSYWSLKHILEASNL